MPKIQPLEEEHYSGILAVVENLSEWFDETARSRSGPTDIRYQEGFVAVSGQRVVGFVTLYVAEGRLHIGWLGVDKQFSEAGSEGVYSCPIPWHMSCLFQAIWRHEADAVRTILNVRPDLVDAWLTGDSWPNEFSGEAWDSRGFEAPRGLDPLAYASVLGAADCVDSLLAAGAGVESVSYGADMGWCTPLIQAAFQDKEEALFSLLRHGANPNVKGSVGSTALMTAAGHGRSAMVDALPAAGAEMTIHVAAVLGDLQEVDRILGESSAWLEAKDSYRATPLDDLLAPLNALVEAFGRPRFPSWAGASLELVETEEIHHRLTGLWKLCESDSGKDVMPMTIDNVHWFLGLFDELGVKVWIDGGWGVDALLGESTRRHDDLDIIIGWSDSRTLTEALMERGFVEVHTDDRKDRNFVLGHQSHGRIDFHVIGFAKEGGGIYGPGEIDWAISESELNAEGTIGGRTVRCLSADYQVRSHSGYPLKATDFADMNALHERFGVELSEEQINRENI